jgi:hypothetical protein
VMIATGCLSELMDPTLWPASAAGIGPRTGSGLGPWT